MKNNCILFFICFFVSGIFAQKRTAENLIFADQTVTYSRVDYSKYGTLHFFVAMYDDTEELKRVEKEARKCLRRTPRLYHTLYFFLKVPKGIKDQEKKERLFINFHCCPTKI